MMTSKAEYLKRYMSDEPVAKKKKKEKRLVVGKSRVKIFDDDVDFETLLPENINNTLDDDIGDDSPAVAEFVDERPKHVKELERFRQSNQWKLVSLKPDTRSDDGYQSHSKVSHSAELTKKLSKGHQGVPATKRHDSDSDLDVPRDRSQRRHDSDSDLSPVRIKHRSDRRHDSDSSSSDLSPVRTGSQTLRHHDSDSDLSPVRASGRDDSITPGNRHDSDSDLSPVRAKDRSAIKTAHAGSRRHDSGSDLSPPRTKTSSHRHDSDSDLSPVRSNRDSEHSFQQHSKSAENSRQTKTLSGATAGLQLAADMRKEAQLLKKRENASFAKISDELLGKNAQTIVRDKATGRKRDLTAEHAKQAETDAAQAATAAKYNAWNKGLRQKELQDERISDALHEAEKPLARYSDDADLDARLREQEREGDTMLAYVRKKKEKGTTKSKPVYKGPEPPLNRFGIRPGYRWDGVDRSNGFEKQYFTRLSEKRAIKDMAYKWSVENM